MPRKYGRAMHAPSMELDDWLAHPMWTRLPESSRRDELWVRPILEPKYVNADLLRGSLLYVLVKSQHPDRFGIAAVWNRGRLGPPSLWWRGRWSRLAAIPSVEYPFYFTVVPAILGEEAVKFVVKAKDSKYAVRSKRSVAK